MNLTKKRILVTGADGFIGSHLTESLVKSCKSVRALCQYNSFNSWGWLNDNPVANDIEIVTGDIRDPHFCNIIAKDIDVIFHLAALIAIPYSYAAPHSYIDTNVAGTLNICQAALTNQCERIIHTSTSEVYGTAKYVPIDENHPLQPQSPYSASKIGADMVAMSYYNSFDLPLIIARPFNTYGPRQSARAVIPTIIIQIANGNKRIKLGDVSPTRDFNYVKDTCNGFMEIAKKEGLEGEVINIGSGSEISIGDVLKLIKKNMNSEVEFITENLRLRPEKSEVYRLCCDNTKIRELTGFEPRYSIEQGIDETIAWFTDIEKANLSMYKDGIYNV